MSQYRLLLLDDEEFVLANIQKVFHFEEYGFLLAGAYSRPLRALERLPEDRPDLIITDIRMPLMNGLEFAQKAREILPDAEIVILSGYDDFSYAQSAVKIGVRDYLLKPIKKDDFSEMLTQMHQKIADKKKNAASIRALQERVERNENELKTNFFLQLAENDHVNWNRMRQTYDHLHLQFEDMKFILVKFDFHEMKFEADTMSEVGKLSVDIESTLSVFGEIESFLSDEYVYIFLSFGQGEMIRDQVEASMRQFSREQSEKGISFIAGISQEHCGMHEVFTASQECNQMMWMAGMKTADAMENLTGILNQNLRIPYEHMEELFRIITEGRGQGIERAVGEIYHFPESLREHLSMQYSYSISFLILLRLIQIQHRYKIRERIIPEELLELKNLRYQYPSVSEQKEMITEYAEVICELIGAQEQAVPSQMVAKAQAYVREHYMDNISLSSTADSIGISMNYLSEIFKKETGSTFINFVTNVRIEKAKILLRESKLKMYEISMAVGFQDYTYFSQLFKKRTGMTLSAYRKMQV